MVDTTVKLVLLRSEMEARGLDAYVVSNEDPHNSEYVPKCFKRRNFISEFTGSAGTALITKDKAVLYTDGRYFLQAEKQLDKNWTLMKDRLTSTIPQDQWLANELTESKVVGVDATTTSINYVTNLSHAGLEVKLLNENLVDIIWSEKSPLPSNPVIVHPEIYSGQPFMEKITNLRTTLKENNLGAVGLFNIRGSDVPYNPVVLSYALITLDEAKLFVDKTKITSEVMKHFNNEIKIFEYLEIFDHLKELKQFTYLDTMQCNISLLNAVEKKYQKTEPESLIALPIALKNDTELNGFRECHITDGVALVRFLAWLENEIMIKDNTTINEVIACDKLKEFRSQGKDFSGLSFETISGSGPNGAIIHYKPSKKNCGLLDKNKIYLNDSGGQYFSGTTDVTRTVQFGNSTKHEKYCYTKVLQGHIDLATARFPNGTTGRDLDVLARLPLWSGGLNYNHGTGHGVGSFLNVHEGPQGISPRERKRVPLLPRMTMTIEPGYYEENNFGIRIENCYIVIDAETDFNFDDQIYYTFEAVTMAPMDPDLILIEDLTEKQLNWLNQYHKTVKEKLKPKLEEYKDQSALDWLEKKTKFLSR